MDDSVLAPAAAKASARSCGCGPGFFLSRGRACWAFWDWLLVLLRAEKTGLAPMKEAAYRAYCTVRMYSGRCCRQDDMDARMSRCDPQRRGAPSGNRNRQAHRAATPCHATARRRSHARSWPAGAFCCHAARDHDDKTRRASTCTRPSAYRVAAAPPSWPPGFVQHAIRGPSRQCRGQHRSRCDGPPRPQANTRPSLQTVSPGRRRV